MRITALASGSSGNAYVISNGQTKLLLDAGIPIRKLQKKCEFNLVGIDGCLVTHCHKDHSAAAQALTRYGIDIYASSGTIQACDLSGQHIKPVKAKQSFSVGSFVILPFEVQHDAPEPLGFLIASPTTEEKLLYFTDTYYLKYNFNGLTHIMGECNYSIPLVRKSVQNGQIPEALAKRLIKSHMSLEHFKEYLQATDLSKVRQIYLLHLSENNSNSSLFKQEIQKLTGKEVYVC